MKYLKEGKFQRNIIIALAISSSDFILFTLYSSYIHYLSFKEFRVSYIYKRAKWQTLTHFFQIEKLRI